MENCGKFNVGDRGQRYEVWYFERESGERKRYGWTNQADGGALLDSAKLNPIARDPFVVDRQPDKTPASLYCPHCGSAQGMEPMPHVVRKFCGACGSDVSVSPKPERRLVVEFEEDLTTGFAVPATIRPNGYVRIIGEIKPITRDQIGVATAKTIGRYTGGPYNQLWIRMMLKELGIEVED